MLSGCVCSYLHKYRLYNIFFPKNKWKNWLSHTWKHKNRHIIYFSSVCSWKIMRKYVFLYTLAAILDFAILGLFSTYKKMQSLFFLIFMIFQNQVKNQF